MRAFRGKFMLIDCAQQKTFVYARREDGSIEYGGKQVPTPSVRVKLQAVVGTAEDQSEDFMFGQATPYGQTELAIANPEVAKPLIALWSEYLVSETMTTPQFYVDLTPIDEGAG